MHNDPNNSIYADQLFAGLLDRGFWRARPLDTIGALFSYNTVSPGLSALQADQLALGVPAYGGVTTPQGREMIFELNYDVHVVTGVNVEPVFQYVVHPNAQKNIRDSVVLGAKTHVSF